MKNVVLMLWAAISFFHVTARAQTVDHAACVALMSAHIESSKGFVRWDNLTNDMAKRHSATVVIRIPTKDLTLSPRDLTELDLPAGSRLVTLTKFSTLARGSLYHVIAGDAAEIAGLQGALATRYAPAQLGYQVLGSNVNRHMFQLPTPATLVELNDAAHPSAVALEEELVTNKDTRVALLDTASGTMVFYIPRAEFEAFPSALLDHLGITRQVQPAETKISDHIRSAVTLFQGRAILVTRNAWVISQKAFAALKTLEGREIRHTKETSVDVAEQLKAALASELAECAQPVCVIPTEPKRRRPRSTTESVKTGEVSRQNSERIYAFLRAQRPDLTWSNTGQLPEYFKSALAQRLAPDQLAKGAAEIDAIGFLGSDHVNSRVPGSAAERRLINAVRVLARYTQPALADQAIDDAWIEAVLNNTPSALEERSEVPASTSTPAPAPVTAQQASAQFKPQRLNVNDFTIKQRHETLYAPHRTELSSERPYALVNWAGTQAWVVIAGEYLEQNTVADMIQQIEALSGTALSEAVQYQLVELKTRQIRASQSASRLSSNAGKRRMLDLISRQEVMVVAPQDQTHLDPVSQKRLIVVPLDVKALIREDVEDTVEVEDAAPVVSTPAAEPAAPTAPLAVIPQRTQSVITVGNVNEHAFIGDRADLEQFLSKYAHYAVPSYVRPGESEIVYFRNAKEGPILIGFTKAWSRSSLEVIEIRSLSEINERDQKYFWRRAAREHGYESQTLELPNGKRLSSDRGQVDLVRISGSILYKLIVKHRYTRNDIDEILLETRAVSRDARGEYHATVRHKGSSHEVFFAYDDHGMNLKTIFKR